MGPDPDDQIYFVTEADLLKALAKYPDEWSRVSGWWGMSFGYPPGGHAECHLHSCGEYLVDCWLQYLCVVNVGNIQITDQTTTKWGVAADRDDKTSAEVGINPSGAVTGLSIGKKITQAISGTYAEEHVEGKTYSLSIQWILNRHKEDRDVCRCGTDQPPAMTRDPVPPPVLSQNDVRPIVDPAFDVAEAAVGLLPETRRIKVYAADGDFNAADDLVMVRNDDRAGAVAGVNAASTTQGSDEPAIDVTTAALAAGLAGLLIVSGDADGGGPGHYLTFDAPPTAPATPTATGIQSIAAADGSATTLQSYRGRTAPMSVDTSGLDRNAIIAVGRRAADSNEEPVTAAKLATDLVVVQEDEAGRTIRQTHFGRLEGEGLGALPASEAVVGVIDSTTGRWRMDTVRPVADVMKTPEGAAPTGMFRPSLSVDPRQVKAGQQFEVRAGAQQKKQMAATMNVPEPTLEKIGWTDLYIRGELVDSQPLGGGPAQGTGTALESDGGQVPVSAKYRIERSAEAVDAVNAEFDRVRERAEPSLDALPAGAQTQLRANLDRSRLYATELATP